MRDLYVELLSPRPLNTRQEGQEILQLWLELLPELAPEKFDNWEPIRQSFSVESAVEGWRWPFLATRRKPNLLASVHMRKGPRRQHSTIKVSVDSAALRKAVQPEALARFLKEMSTLVLADFALLHLLSPPHVERGIQAGTVAIIDPAKQTPYFDVSTGTLERSLPDLFWATVFGLPYVQLFGRDRLLDAPAHRVESLAYGGCYLQLTDDPLDERDRFAEVDAVRTRVKEHLDQNAFFDPTLHPTERDFSGRGPNVAIAKSDAWYAAHEYRVPHFEYAGRFEVAGRP